MSKREYFLRYSLLIKRLQRGHATFQEISNYLDRESELLDCNLTISKRTFQRDLIEIQDIFQIDIQYDFSRKVYSIIDGNQSAITSRMLEAFDMFNALSVADDLSHYIYFEKRKSQGTENFYGLLHCIKNHFVVHFPYHKYEEDIVVSREVEPLALREFKGRWYLIAKDQNDGYIKTFGLDRIQELSITKKKFEPPSDLNINNLFKDFFGIVNSSLGGLTEIVLSFDPLQGKYVKSFPLHFSQELLINNEKETRIKLQLHITYDFVMELLSYGDRLKVISPQNLIDELRLVYKQALNQYED